jgi:hypothetical protein
MSARIAAAAAALLLAVPCASRAADTPAPAPTPTVHQGAIEHGSVCEQIIAAAARRAVQEGGDILDDNTVGGPEQREGWKTYVDRLNTVLGPVPPTERLSLPDYITAKGPIIVSERWRLASGKVFYFGCVAAIVQHGDQQGGTIYYGANTDAGALMDLLRTKVSQ